MSSNYKAALNAIGRKIRQENSVVITIPEKFSFKDHNVYNFSKVLSAFDWSLKDRQVKIDLSLCSSANYQALSLIVLYCWRLKSQGCTVSINEAKSNLGASEMWRNIGARGTFPVLISPTQNFVGNKFKPMFAVRNVEDFKAVIETAETYTREINIEYTNTLRYILSELLYNTMEHGYSSYTINGHTNQMPSLVQFTYYQKNNELHFIIADLGIGIKRHIEQAYPGQESHMDAIKLAIRPNVSGTFTQTNPYKAKNNAGVGLYISTNIVRRLSAEMQIISGDGRLHVSGRDITGHTQGQSWPGTFVLVTVKLGTTTDLSLHKLMQEFRDTALAEMRKADKKEEADRFYFSIANQFGRFAEYKPAAISFRDNKLFPAITEGKNIVIDCDQVVNAPHSFLSALLASPIKALGINAYKRIKIVNASSEVRETIDFIMDENTE